MDTREFVAKGIKKVFEDLAVAVAEEEAEKHGADVPAGMIAFEVVKAETYLLMQWARFVDRETKKQNP